VYFSINQYFFVHLQAIGDASKRYGFAAKNRIKIYINKVKQPIKTH